MRVRLGTADDAARVRRLWADTYPHQPDVDPTPALSQGRVLVGARAGDQHGQPARAAAFTSPVPDRPTERRLQVVAETGEDWQAMHTAALDRLRRQGVERWHVTVREDSVAVLERLADAGYEVTSRSWGATLHLREDDLPGLERLARLAEGRGVRLRRLRDGDAGAAHALFQRCREDFPTTPVTTPPDHSLEEVAGMISGGGAAAFGAFTLAEPTGLCPGDPEDGLEGSSGESLVALTVMRAAGAAADQGDEAAVADTEFTVTDRSARGRGLATAVKAHGVLHLARQGVRTFRTGGAEANEASLRANRRLGYVVEPLWLTLSAR